ncbi:damage-inducible protein [Amycolatopsis sp. RM579]|uniref:Damage-inducible protein n=2 Tax=Amycolatopsis pithecellobii TaxID=664692 RepID=A0A6N7Z1Y7_9PSEU|nr:damage-inducible protein [Amycolatopsis pithecellobii]
MFGPQKVDPPDRERQMFMARPGQPLPWEPDHDLAGWRIDRDQAWRHTVYLGIYRRADVFDVLSQVFEPDQDSYDERPGGDSAIAAFLVGEDGRALLNSEVLSSCAWATGEVHRSQGCGPDWLALLQDAELDFSAEWRDFVTDEVFPGDEDTPPQYVPRVLDFADLMRCLEIAVGAAGTSAALSVTDIRIQSQIVARRNADSPGGHDFLNSFIMSDLALVAEQTAKDDIGAALRDYLRPATEIPTGRRVDVRDRLDHVLAGTAPRAVPSGRWPSNPAHALALNQQLAVITASGLLDTTGLIGVNGPPGTGKTTMLRDLIADLVVTRAQRLAALPEPSGAFTGQRLSWRTGERKRVIHPWNPNLTGFEIVLASTNNGAVQNVTDEIPAADAIDESWQEHAAEVDYFTDIATALLAPGPKAEPGKTPAAEDPHGWALVAARLGNKANRSRFVDNFWYHKPIDPAADDAWHGMWSVLKTYEQTPPDSTWAAATEEFRTAEARVEEVRAERAAVYQSLDHRSGLVAGVAGQRQAVAEAGQRADAARARREDAVDAERVHKAEADRIALARQAETEQAARDRLAVAEDVIRERTALIERLSTGRRATAERKVQSYEREAADRWTAHEAHQDDPPGWGEIVRTLGGAKRKWSRKDKWLAKQVAAAKQELTEAHQELGAVQTEIDAAQRDVDAAAYEVESVQRMLTAGIPVPDVYHEPLVTARRAVAVADEELTSTVHAHADATSKLQALEEELAVLDGRLADAAAALGRHYPDTAWWQDRERRELAALWTDAEWNTARSALFLAALALHKAFLRHLPTEMRQNLQAAMDVVNGEAPRDADDEAVLAAWQSLFFVVPVVSTTFASYARLFGHLGREALGWLLIDEAGQATPQNAAGALWRTRRAVVVGDPLQLEPITVLPFRAEQAIRREFDVDEQWLTSHTSVQRLADRLTSLGTWLPGDDAPTWVGIPLTVHRRCDQPMFGIVNAVAYDGLMIDGTAPAAGERFAATYPTLPVSKWIDVPGNAAQGHWIPGEGVQLDRILRTLATLDFDMSDVMVIGPFRDIARQVQTRSRRYRGLVAGTVHTAQGKQADIVVLVLGSAPDRPGARRWAASKPNLLNVAVSRAKHRLYVIGDHQAWSPLPYFKVLATKVPRTDPI